MTAQPGFATQAEAYQALIRQGADPNLANILAAVTRPESSGYTAARNDFQGNSYLGLWQVGSMHGFDNRRLQSDDIDYQAAAALSVYHQQGFGAWETYTNGTYRQYLGQNGDSSGVAQAIFGANSLAGLAGIAAAGAGEAAAGVKAATGAPPLLASQITPISGPVLQSPGNMPNAADAPGLNANPTSAPDTPTTQVNPIDAERGADKTLQPGA